MRTVRLKENPYPEKASTELLDSTSPTQGNIFNEVSRDGDVRRFTEVYDDGYYTALCWLEIITLKEHKNGSSDVNKEYAILLETPGDIPTDYLEKRKYNNEDVIPYEVIDNDTKKSRVVNFTRVDVSRDLTVLQNRKMLCASGPVYTKEYIEWPKSTKRRIEFKVSPKKEAALVVKPVKKEDLGSITQATDHVPVSSEKEIVKNVEVPSEEDGKDVEVSTSSITATDIPKIDQQKVARETVSEKVTYKNTDINKNNGTDNRKKKKKVVSETQSTKRISSYHSTIRNELDGGNNSNQPITRKYVLETTVTNKPNKAPTDNSSTTTSDDMESQSSYSNAVVAFPPQTIQMNELNHDTFCPKSKEHVVLLKINVVMEHNVISPKGNAFVFPVMTMEKQVEFRVQPDSINKSESVTLLSENEKWKDFLNKLTREKRANRNRSRYSNNNNNNGFSNTVTVDEATKYVTELQNSLGACLKYQSKIQDNEQQGTSKKRRVAGNNVDFAKFPTTAHAINYYLNQPTAEESSPAARRAISKKITPESDAKNKNRSMFITDVKRNRKSEEYIIEEMIDQQPSDTTSKRVVPGLPIKHIRTYKRIVIQADEPEEYSELNKDLEENVIGTLNEIVTTTEPTTMDTVPETLMPESTTETKIIQPLVNNRHVSDIHEGNIFVKVLGTLSSILRRLAV